MKRWIRNALVISCFISVGLTGTALASTPVTNSFDVVRGQLAPGADLSVALASAKATKAVNAIRLDNPDGAQTGFGYSVALSGTTALVGAPRDDNANGTDAGAVYVFTRAGPNNWALQVKLIAAGGASGDAFGLSIAIEGDTLLVGAPAVGQNDGSVYVYVRNGGVWSLQRQFTDGGNAFFGGSVAISGNTAVVGKPDGDTSWANAGSADVFVRSGTIWTQQGFLSTEISDQGQFGKSVAIFGNTIVVGAPLEDLPQGANAGAAYVFQRSGTSWSRQAKLTSIQRAAGDQFGYSVAVGADLAVIGAPTADLETKIDRGLAFSFSRSGPNWSEAQALYFENGLAGDKFGSSVAVADGRYVVGIPMDDTIRGVDSGSVANYLNNPMGVIIFAGDGKAGDQFGGSVAASRGAWLVGSVFADGVGTDNPDVGAAYVYLSEYGLSYAAGANGSINGNSFQIVTQFDDGTAVAAIPQTNHHFVQWSDGSISNPRTDRNVTSSIDVTALFAIDQYAVTTASNGNGSIMPPSQLVNHGSAVSFGVTPAIGYHVASMVGDTCLPTDAGGGNWSASNITAPCVVSANFAINEYGLTYSSGANGSLGGELSQTVTHGGTGSAVTAIPAANHHFVQWSDGLTNNPRTEVNVTGDINVVAQFAIDTFSLSYAAASNGSIAGMTSQTVDYGAAGSAVTPTPAAGYRFLQWSDASTANPRTDVGVTANLAVTATFGNSAPTIGLVSGAPVTIFEAESSTISVTASDVEESSLNYAFDCDNNGGYEIGPQSAPSAGCMFGAAGNRAVGVRVADGPGLFVTSSVDITVENSAPTVTLNPDATPLEDMAIPLGAIAAVPSTGESITLVEADCDYDGVTFTADQSSASAALLACPGYPTGGGRTIAARSTDSEPESSPLATALVTVTAVNDRPVLLLGTVGTHPAASNGQQSVLAFATVDVGPSDEDATQSVDDFLIDSISDSNGVLVPNTPDIANNGTLTYELTGIGGIANIAVRVRDDGGIANGGENTSTAQQFTINVTPGADLELEKDNSRSGLIDGESTVYAIVVANAGPNAVVGARISDPLPNTLINGSWTCVPAASTASCPSPGANPGNLDAYIDLGVNQYLRFDVMAEVDGNVGAFVTNIASVVVPNGTTAINTSNDSATDQDPLVPIGVFSDGFETAPAQVLTVPGAEQAMGGD